MLEERSKTVEELNAELYEKVSAEFEEYKNNLLEGHREGLSHGKPHISGGAGGG